MISRILQISQTPMLDDIIVSTKELAYKRLIDTFSDPETIAKLQESFKKQDWDPGEVDPKIISMLRGMERILEVVDQDLGIEEIRKARAGIAPLLAVLLEYWSMGEHSLATGEEVDLPFPVNFDTMTSIEYHIMMLEFIYSNEDIPNGTILQD